MSGHLSIVVSAHGLASPRRDNGHFHTGRISKPARLGRKSGYLQPARPTARLSFPLPSPVFWRPGLGLLLIITWHNMRKRLNIILMNDHSKPVIGQFIIQLIVTCKKRVSCPADHYSSEVQAGERAHAPSGSPTIRLVRGDLRERKRKWRWKFVEVVHDISWA